MPSPRRKTKTPTNPKQHLKVDNIPAAIQQVAKTLNLEVAALLDWKEYPEGKLVLIAPNGMKFVVENPQMAQQIMCEDVLPTLELAEVQHER